MTRYPRMPGVPPTYICPKDGITLATSEAIKVRVDTGQDDEFPTLETTTIGVRVVLAAGYTNRKGNHPDGFPWYRLRDRRPLDPRLPERVQVRKTVIVTCACGEEYYIQPFGDPRGHANLTRAELAQQVLDEIEEERIDEIARETREQEIEDAAEAIALEANGF